MSESLRREVSAVIESDLMLCEANSAAALRSAVIASVRTLFPPTVKVQLWRDPKEPWRVVRLEVVR